MGSDTTNPERRIQTVCLLILTTVAIGMALYLLRPVLIPFVLAIFLVYCLTPIIDVQVRTLNVPRALAVVTTILLGCLVLFGVWLLVWASVSQMTENAGAYEEHFKMLVQDTAERLPLERFGVDAEDLPAMAQLSHNTARELVSRLISAIMSVLSNGLLVVIFMIFIVAGSSSGSAKPGSIRAQVDEGVKRYILTKVLVSAATGILVGVTLAIFGVKLAMVFGLLAFLLNFIPSIGSVVSTLLPLPVVLLMSPELSGFAKLMAIAIPGGIQFAIGNLLEPRIMGRSLDLHPVVVLLGLIFFGMIWGIIGMILATPIVAVTKIILERIEVTAPVGQVLAGKLD